MEPFKNYPAGLTDYTIAQMNSRGIETIISMRLIQELYDSGSPIVAVEYYGESERIPTPTGADVLNEMFNSDELFLIASNGDTTDWVHCVMGQDWDMIVNYTMPLDAALAPINDWIQSNW